ncbi:sigma-70 family RNA polymerase sigma factor [Terasakiella pusilla]|uniref:sigma-70 family RNA polymerase sigma factor n=1 Tax=Terasakiella pusilla TaxID=64973 RepID=UPI0005715BF7|nr:sigma-70 family RNA polymerase sigma factor [Terasakiella pusilla]
MIQNSNVEYLYNEHNIWLKSWLRTKLNCSYQAADLAQDTFVRVLMRRDELNMTQLRKPQAYLRVIAKGLLVDHFRRKDVERTFLEALSHLPQPEVISPEAQKILLETLQQIDYALDRLPAPVRQAFLLSQLEGASYQEIADLINISTRTVKRYMQKGFSQCLLALA